MSDGGVTGTAYHGALLWSVFAGLGIGSFALRFIFLGLIGDRSLPEWLLRHLRYTAVAILPGLVAPLVVWPSGTDGQVDPARLAAALVTLGVGYWSKNLPLSLLAGALVLAGGLALS